MDKFSEFYKARNIISDILIKDLIGPVKENEILSELPTQYYIMGKLYPAEDTEEALNMASDSVLENPADTYDASISLSNQRNPSSMGITCTLKPGVDCICVSSSYAFYESLSAGEAGVEPDESEKGKKESIYWKRHEYHFKKDMMLGMGKGKIAEVTLDHGMLIQAFSHETYQSGERVITVVLLNTNVANPKDTPVEKAGMCAFQCEIRIFDKRNRPVFTETSHAENFSTDEELQELELLYKDVHAFAQGHGCAADWDRDSVNGEPLWVGSVWMPKFNLSQMMPAQRGNSKVYSIKFLAYSDSTAIVSALRQMTDSYEAWIQGQENKARSLEVNYQPAAKKNINKCRETLGRIRHSIYLLDSDPVAMQAFKYANEAMLIQREQFLKRTGVPFNADKITWYPFQLAFIVQEISSFVDKDSKDRKLADLLWFPTGGGKTEAYLGISAFVIFLRRLRNPDDDGVTVIMRYTLRLLTLQQFERASLMICACELLRERYKLGGSEISIGLWVGGGLTPNKLTEAENSILKQQNGALVRSGETNPCQIQVCPWCGAELTPHDYLVDKDSGRMIISCSDPDCEFHKDRRPAGLPLHIVDEAVYNYVPAFIVATVDKFAQIPLSDKAAAIFGVSNHKNPPELIIQDELHLISGPLGTMTGIYEAAISELCKYKGGPGAKVIASTATIRNAGWQLLELYGKNYTQFPPQGISIKDSYFAVESKPENKPARLYCGVMGVGTTPTTTLIRVDAALLYASKVLEALHFPNKVIDNFWTITGYFNSLRELGGSSIRILDDVQSRFSYLAKTKFDGIAFNSVVPKVDPDKKYDFMVELTSRMDNSEITSVLQKRLKCEYHDGKHREVLDFLLASNMISVGVDIGRLGTMVVTGQPKTNAEYIQATSRVGRENPGLVVTIYNSSRSRDRSHYEQFVKYHSALYRYVEAISLTPFADRARDRGLQALFVSLCRYLIPGMLGNSSAGRFCSPDNDLREKVNQIKKMIIHYVGIVDPDEVENVQYELDNIEMQWIIEARQGNLDYKNYKGKNELLKPDTMDDRFRTMNSMRSVEEQSGIYLLGR